MSKISKDGADQIVILRNALDVMYDKLQKAGRFTMVQEEFQFIAELVDTIQHDWEKV